MADILIRGMEIPKTCWNCKLKVGFYACGLVTDHKDGGLFYRVHIGNSRPDWCPLVPLPAGHGRGIDADALMEIIRAHDYPLTAHFNSTDNGMFTLGIQQAVDEAPTIVPAEGVKE